MRATQLLGLLGGIAFASSCDLLDLQHLSDQGGLSGRYTRIDADPELANRHHQRPVFVRQGPQELRLAFQVDDEYGRWVFHDPTAGAVAFVDSWALSPHLIHAVHSNAATADARLRVLDVTGAWQPRPLDVLQCRCASRDKAVLVASDLIPEIGGVYLPLAAHAWTSATPTGVPRFLFRRDAGQWLLGEELNATSGLAFALTPRDCDSATELAQGGATWSISDGAGGWRADPTLVVHATDNDESVWQLLRRVRGRKHERQPNPTITQPWHLLAHGNVSMPMVGLGTGGLDLSTVGNTVDMALNVGYRLIDTAAEYANEGDIGRVLRAHPTLVRDDVFITSKVWPTDLGFEPTLASVAGSLARLGTDYLDLHLLHWPFCVDAWPWMHCSRRDPTLPPGTWQSSWLALEKLHAEGRLLSIGVSNFDLSLLTELVFERASVAPAVVQNWLDPQHRDDLTGSNRNHAASNAHTSTVVDFAAQQNILYQAYASLRNMAQQQDRQQEDDTSHVLHEVGRALAPPRSAQAVALRWLLQQGIAVIPRSSQWAHLAENLEAGSFGLPPAAVERISVNSLPLPQEEL